MNLSRSQLASAFDALRESKAGPHCKAPGRSAPRHRCASPPRRPRGAMSGRHGSPAFPRDEDQLLTRFRLTPADASGESDHPDTTTAASATPRTESSRIGQPGRPVCAESGHAKRAGRRNRIGLGRRPGPRPDCERSLTGITLARGQPHARWLRRRRAAVRTGIRHRRRCRTSPPVGARGPASAASSRPLAVSIKASDRGMSRALSLAASADSAMRLTQRSRVPSGRRRRLCARIAPLLAQRPVGAVDRIGFGNGYPS